MLNIKNVAVAISGGVDSAVTAILLKKKGYNLVGVFMKNWDLTDETGFCTTAEDMEDAKYVCRKIDIPLHEVNFVKEYWNEVFTNFIADYQRGWTPNPDIDCNRHIKFNLYFKYAMEFLKVDAIATGHYAKTSFGSYLSRYSASMNVKLLKPKDDFKDQTLFLSQIPQEALKRTMFPLGEYEKEDVKQIALEYGLEKIVRKRESTGICFIGLRNFQNFINDYIPPKPGNVIDISTGKRIGNHNGIHLWTLGQRYPIGGYVERFFVASKNVETNDMYLAPGTAHPSLFSQMIYTEKPYWIDNSNTLKSLNIIQCEFRFQHTKPLQPCNVFVRQSGELLIILDKPLKALTPGQYAVIYNGEECLGSARIYKVGPSYFALGYKVSPSYEEYEHHPKNNKMKSTMFRRQTQVV